MAKISHKTNREEIWDPFISVTVISIYYNKILGFPITHIQYKFDELDLIAEFWLSSTSKGENAKSISLKLYSVWLGYVACIET